MVNETKLRCSYCYYICNNYFHNCNRFAHWFVTSPFFSTYSSSIILLNKLLAFYYFPFVVIVVLALVVSHSSSHSSTTALALLHLWLSCYCFRRHLQAIPPRGAQEDSNSSYNNIITTRRQGPASSSPSSQRTTSHVPLQYYYYYYNYPHPYHNSNHCSYTQKQNKTYSFLVRCSTPSTPTTTGRRILVTILVVVRQYIVVLYYCCSLGMIMMVMMNPIWMIGGRTSSSIQARSSSPTSISSSSSSRFFVVVSAWQHQRSFSSRRSSTTNTIHSWIGREYQGHMPARLFSTTRLGYLGLVSNDNKNHDWRSSSNRTASSTTASTTTTLDPYNQTEQDFEKADAAPMASSRPSRPLLSWPDVTTTINTKVSASELSITSEKQDEKISSSVEQQEQQQQPSARFVPFPFAYHEIIDVRIESLTTVGWGVGRVDLTNYPSLSSSSASSLDNYGKGNTMEEEEVENYFSMEQNYLPFLSSTTTTTSTNSKRLWVVMVPNVIPNELVRVRIFRNYKNYSEADLIEILESSSGRILQPKCNLALECGGCQFQHIHIHLQRLWKMEQVQIALQQYNISNYPMIQSILGTNEIYHYRSKITPHYQIPNSKYRNQRNNKSINKKPKQPLNPKDLDHMTNVVSTTTTSFPSSLSVSTTNSSMDSIQAIGFEKKTSRQLVDVTYCPIATPEVNSKYNMVRQQLLSMGSPKGGATLLIRQDNLPESSLLSFNSNDEKQVVIVTTDHNQPITTIVRGLKFTYLAGNFFQNNYYVLPLMVESVIRFAIGNNDSSIGSNSNTKMKKMTHLIDCYCGSGLFALSLASYFDIVVGIEINGKAILEAKYNAQQNHITNCNFIAATSETIFDQVQHFPNDETVIVLDPPRKGCSIEFLQQLYHFQPERIIYMSCNPITQARDIRWLMEYDGGSSNNNDDDTDDGYEYRIEAIQPFDLFPQTRHIECLMILQRIKKIGKNTI